MVPSGGSLDCFAPPGVPQVPSSIVFCGLMDGARFRALEAMAMRKAIVTTSVGCDGIDRVHGESALLAETPGAGNQSARR